MKDKNQEICIAIDAMGSDKGPSEVIAGVKLALSEHRKNFKVLLVGDENILNPILKEQKLSDEKTLRIVHASEVITMEDKPMVAIKTKKNSSMLIAIDLVKTGQAQALVSCGNTGAMMAAGTLRLRPMTPVERPALATIIPSKDRTFVMLDVGANPSPKDIHFLSNAILGTNYARIALGIENPKVGLLTIGTEEGKGNEIVQRAHELLKNSTDAINYAGPIEGFQVFQGDCDVILCDGFTGNIVLKASEGLFKMLMTLLKEEFKRNILRKFGILLASGAIKSLKKRINVEKVSGAPLLGLNGLIVKGHGSSSKEQICGAISICANCVRKSMNEHIKSDLEKVSKLLDQNQDNDE